MPAPLVLDLVRHGHAEPGGSAGDQARRLTPGGRSALERLGAHLEREGARHNRVLASPLVRAAESATAVLGAFATHPAVETLEELSPDSTPKALLAALRGLGAADGHALLVGHQPLLGQLTLLLTGTETTFAPGSLVRIECPRGPVAGSGRILLALHPTHHP
jgi:phosphohistidine phosphatase